MSHPSTQLGHLAQLLEPVLLLDKDYTILDLNQTACNLLQTSKEAFIGEIFPFDLRLNQGLEVELPDTCGQLLLYTVQAQPFAGSETDCILVRFFRSPLSEPKPNIAHADATIALANVLNQLNLSAIIIDENGGIAHCTDAAHRSRLFEGDTLLGRRAAQMIDDTPSLKIPDDVPLSQKLMDVLGSENTPASQAKLDIEFEDGRRFELISIALDGRLTPSLTNQLIVFCERNPPTQAECDKALDSKQLQLMAAGIAHDFKNLLSAIISHLSIARLKIERPEVTEKLDAAEEAAWQAKTLSQRLMHLADPRKPAVDHQAAYNLAGLLRACVHMHLKNSKTSYELILDEPLWDCSIEYTQMTQVINNLLINAQQAMPDGGHIEIKASNAVNPASKESPHSGKQQDFICLHIRDTGPGISPSNQTRIFEPYFTTKAKGHGIGLANCKNIIDAHEGHLRVESKMGQGSTFIIQLPRASTPAVEKKVATNSSKPSTAPKRASAEKSPQIKGRILVMDDMEAMRDVAGDILNLLGYEYALTEDGQAAIDLYFSEKERGQAFDAVLFDLTVPGAMGGEEAASAIKEIDPKLKAIACSGYAESDLMQNFAESPFTTVVPKPYRIQEMSDALTLALDKG